MFTVKISDSLAELRNDLDIFEIAVSEMIEGKEMGHMSIESSSNLSSEHNTNVAQNRNPEQQSSSGNPASLHALSQTPIAIIGIASLFPEAKDTQSYWDNILREVDCITDVPESRWNSDDYFDADARAIDKTYCKRGGFIPEIDFNPMEFGLPPNVLEATEISQMLALVVAREAMKDAGYGPELNLNHDKTGVVLGSVARQLSGPLWGRLQYPIWERVLKSSGVSDEDTQKIVDKIKLAYPSWQENSFPGMLTNVISGRIANRFDFGGLNCNLDAACASSLAALKMSISELVERRADIMLTGGVDPDNSAFTYLCFSKTPALSRSQESRPFDEKGDGIMLGEGVGMVVLKRLEDAERDGDRIYAVIRGLGTSSDGRFKSIYAPRPEGQVKAIRRAYEDANIDPTTVGMVEAHGTGTMAGDPAEFEGMNVVFSENNPRKQHIALGSVKSQIGHTKTAAGVASLIKMALALQHKILPPSINIERPNPKLNIENSPFYLNNKLRPWIRQAGAPPRRAGVSSFGFGGTNFHVVLEEYEAEQSKAYRVNSVPQPVLISAATPAELAEQCQAWLDAFQSDTGVVQYVGLVNASRDRILPATEARLGFMAESILDACAKLKVAVNLFRQLKQDSWEHPQGIYYRASGLALAGKVVALFSGQGSQYLDMGHWLAANFPPIRETFARHDRLLSAEGLEPVSDVVYPLPVFDEAGATAQKQRLQRTEYAQPAIGALSSGLYKIFRQAGFSPNFTAGHSFGELTALWAAGVFSEADYASLVKARGQAMAAPVGRDFDAGAMLAVKGDAARIQAIVETLPGVSIANFNSGQQVVLAGATSAIAQAKTALEAQAFEPVPLPVSAAFHTPLVAHAQVPFSQAVEQVTFNPAQLPVFTNVTGQAYPATPGEMKTLLQQHMVSQVQFKQEIENLYGAGGFCFVEFGPKNVLTNLVKEILGDRPHLAIATNASRHKDSDLQLREAALQLRVAGLALGDIDPYQIPLVAPAAVDAKAQRLMVKIHGASVISDKTRATYEAALMDGHRVTIASSEAAPETAVVAAPSRSVSVIAQGNGFVAEGTLFQNSTQPVPVSGANGAAKGSTNGNGNGSGNGVTNGKSNSNGNGANGNGNGNKSSSTFNGTVQDVTKLVTDLSQGLVANGSGKNGISNNGLSEKSMNGNGANRMSQEVNRVTQSPASAPNGSSTNSSSSQASSASGALVEFSQHQTQVSRTHEQFLEIHREYNQAFLQITQQQQQLLAQQANAELIASVERNLAAFHTLHQETLRVHEQYLSHQMAFDRGVAGTQSVAPASTAQVIPVPQLIAPQLLTPATIAPATIAPAPQAVAPAPVAPAPIAPAPQAVVAPVPVAPAPVVPQSVPQVSAPQVAIATPATPATAKVADIAPKLLAVVSDKTGYPAEMLELDMDMEADLGIDSIKRVEILGALQDEFPELPQPNLEELAEIEMRTLGQVADYMQSKLGAVASPAAPAAPAAPAVAPVVPAAVMPAAAAPVAPSPVPLPTTGSIPVIQPSIVQTIVQAVVADTGRVESQLLEVVSDKTGYPAEMLELDMDMEADLGIDSIKRVEILGALQDAFPELPQPNLEELAEIEMRTLGQVADYMRSKLAGKGSSAPEAAIAPSFTPAPVPTPTPAFSPVPTPSPVVNLAAPAGLSLEKSEVAIALLEPVVAPAAPTGNPAEMQTKLLEVVSDKTGYPAEMLELDMDMEADLGIDSIKRVEILGALQDAFPELPQPNLEELAEIEMRTLGQVADYMQSQREKKNPFVTSLGVQAPEIASGITSDITPDFLPAFNDLLPLTSLPLPRHPAQLQHLPPADWLDFDLPQGHVCLLTDDGTETTTQLAQRLSDKGWKIVVLSFPSTLVARQADLPSGVQRVVLEELGDVALGQQLKAIAATAGTPAAFIHLHPTGFTVPGQALSFPDAEATLVKQVFFLAKHLKAPLNQAATQGRSVFLSVARLDGSFGMGGRGGYSAIAAGLAGLTKTLNFEWRSVFCRAVDLNPALTPAQSVNYILAELHDPDGILPETAYGEMGRVALVAG